MTELFQKFEAAKIRYLLVGGQAMRLFGLPRYSMDWDLLIPPRDETNFVRINSTLEDELDLPLIPLGPKGENFIQTYQTSLGLLQFHLGLPGVPAFNEAEKMAVIKTMPDGIPIKCLSGEHLLAAKLAANRPQDQIDIEFLQELKRLGKL
ncbi:MAG TPA: hypothetical protein VH413_08790 [Verrucomicrobiae bacterium]|jgi:hypothetical protein|nr:hypothetical protein [Verrucomicrobiae bacterium]